MSEIVADPQPLSSDDLPGLSSAQVEQQNQIYTMPAVKVKLETGTFHWHWCYRVNDTAGLGVTLQGEAGRYHMIITKSWQTGHVDQDIRYSDYQADTACIIFSAVHEYFLCIVEQILDDRCVVTKLDRVQPSDSPDELKQQNACNQAFGFRLCDHLDNDSVQGMIYMSSSQLDKVVQKTRQYFESHDGRFERLLFRLPLQIDSVSLPIGDFKSLTSGSVIKLDNNSLMESTSCVSIVIGTNYRVATIAETRGKIMQNTSPEVKTGDIND